VIDKEETTKRQNLLKKGLVLKLYFLFFLSLLLSLSQLGPDGKS
jgi:hypothetical protein